MCVIGACTVISSNGHEDWCVNAGQEIFHRVKGGGWQKMPGAAVNISVGHDGTCWCLNSAQQIWRWQGNNWVSVPGAAVSVGVGSAQDVWVTNAGQEIFHCPGNGQWTKIDGAATHISCGKDGTALCINAQQNIFKRNGPHGRWEQLPGAAVQGDVYDNNTFAVVNKADEIFAWQHGNWVKQPGAAKHVSVGRDNYHHVTCANRGNGIFRHGFYH